MLKPLKYEPDNESHSDFDASTSSQTGSGFSFKPRANFIKKEATETSS